MSRIYWDCTINEWRATERVLRELSRVFGPRQRTFPSSLPTLALDRIYVSPVQAVAGMKVVTTTENRDASDLLPVLCDVTLTAVR